MKRNSIALKVKELCHMFSVENENKTEIYKSMSLYKDFIDWLDNNGAIYSKYIDYPTAFGPLGIIGCKSKCDIGDNTALLFIPKSLIISSDSYFQDKNISKKAKDSLSNGLKLSLILIDEYIKGKESFWYPYISLILSMDYSSFPVNWSSTILESLNNQSILDEIEDFNNEIHNNFIIIKRLYTKEIINIDLFKTIYLFTISRLFYLTDNTSLLILLADLLNHNADTDVKYEIFDSLNHITKHTAALDNEHMLRNMAMYTQCTMYYDYNTDTNNITINNEEFKPLEIDLNIDETIDLKDNDYFIISTNERQVFSKGNEIYNNYGKSSNQYLLINFGFCLIENYYDFSKIQIHLPKGDKDYTEMITKLFTEFNESDEYYSYIIRIKKRKINVKAIDFFRTNHKYSNSLYKYIYNKDNEMEVLKNVIDFYKTSINHDQKTIEQYLDNIIKLSNEGKAIEVNIDILKMTQKINLLYQKDYLEVLLELISKLTNDNNTISFYENQSLQNKNSIIESYDYDIAEIGLVSKAINNYLNKWTLLEENK